MPAIALLAKAVAMAAGFEVTEAVTLVAEGPLEPLLEPPLVGRVEESPVLVTMVPGAGGRGRARKG